MSDPIRCAIVVDSSESPRPHDIGSEDYLLMVKVLFSLGRVLNSLGRECKAILKLSAVEEFYQSKKVRPRRYIEERVW